MGPLASSPDCVKTRVEQKGNALKSRIKRFDFGRGRFGGVFCTILEPFLSYHTASRLVRLLTQWGQTQTPARFGVPSQIFQCPQRLHVEGKHSLAFHTCPN